METKITLKVMDHEEMTGSELINKFNNNSKISHWKNLFLFDGKPYDWCDKYNSVIDGSEMVVFRWSTNGRPRQPILKAYYSDDQFRAMSNGIKVADITGYDIVDAYEGKRYIGTFKSITTK